MTKILIDRSTVEQALEALELYVPKEDYENRPVGNVIDALRDALAEPVQEPVAIVGTQEDTWKGYGGQWAPPGPPIKTVHMLRELPEGTLLYAAPPQRPAEPVQEPVQEPAKFLDVVTYTGTGVNCAALAEQQEPVAWMYTGIKSDGSEHGPHLVWKPEYMDAMSASKGAKATPLYAAPPQRPAEPAAWDGTCVLGYCSSPTGCENDGECRAVERAHGIGGEG